MAGGGILRRIGIALGVDVEDKEAKSNIESLKNFVKNALGTIAVGVSIVKVNALAEEFGAVNRMVKMATKEMLNQTDAQSKILAAANATKSSYADTAKVVSALVQENKDLFGTLDEAIKFNNAATQLFKTAGKTDEEIAELMESINVSFARGAVDSETIGQLLEKSPEAAALLEKKLGASKEVFEQMASDGQISLQQLKEAFTDSAGEIEKSYMESGANITDAIKNIRNQWGLYVSQVWEGAGISQQVAKLMIRAFSGFMAVLNKAQPAITSALKTAMNWMTRIADWISRVGSVLGRLIEHIGGVENAIKLVIIVSSALWLALNFGKIIAGINMIKNGLRGLPGLFNPKNLKIAGFVAAVTLIVLALEDFFNFLKGNDSVIGLFFEKIGVGADKARETILGAFGRVQSFFQEHGSKLKAILGGIAGLFATYKIGVLLAVAAEKAWAIGSAVAAGATKILSAAMIGLTSPIGIVIAIIGSLVAAGIILYQNWDTISAAAIELWKKVSIAFSNGIAVAKNWLNQAIEYIKSLPDQALEWGTDFMKGIANGIANGAKKVVESVKGIANKIKSFLHFSRPDEGPLVDYESWMPDFVGGLARTLQSSKGLLRDAIRGLSETFEEMDAEKAWGKITDTFRNGISTVKNIASKVKIKVGSEQLPTETMGDGKSIIQQVSKKAKEVADGIKSSMSMVKQIIGDINGSLSGTDISENIEKMSKAFSNGMKEVKTSATGVMSYMRSNWQLLGNILVNPVSGGFNFIYNHCSTFRNYVDGFLNGIEEKWKNGWNSVKEISLSCWTSMVGGSRQELSLLKATIRTGFQSAIDFITSLPSQALQWGKDFIAGLKDGILSGISGITEAVSGIAGKVKSFLHFSRPDEGPLADYESWMPDFVDGLAKTLRSSKDVLRDAIRGLSETFEEMDAEKAWKKITDTFRTGIRNVKNIISKAKIKVGSEQVSTETADDGKVVAQQIIKQATETRKTWNDVWNGMIKIPANFWTLIVEESKRESKNLTATIRTGFQSAIDFITSLPSQALHHGKNFAVALKKGIFSGISGIKDTISAAIKEPEKIRARTFTMLKDVASVTRRTVAEINNSLNVDAEPVVSRLVNAFRVGANGIKDSASVVISYFRDNWKQIGDLLENPISKGFELVYNHCSGFRNFINGFIGDTQIDWSGGWTMIKEIADSAWAAMTGGARQGLISLKSAIRSGMTDATSFIKGLPNDALKWGSDIIDGIASGIRNAAGKVTNAVKGVADRIRSFLHFSRPDEGPLVDYETWMPDFVGGLARTLKENKGLLTSAALDVSRALNITPTVNTTAKAVGDVRRGNTINQKVEINNTVKTTDAKAGREASKQLDRSSNDVTKKIADGLAYGRA